MFSEDVVVVFLQFSGKIIIFYLNYALLLLLIRCFDSATSPSTRCLAQCLMLEMKMFVRSDQIRSQENDGKRVFKQEM